MDADEHTWAYICTYMQEGPSALPPPAPPKDHNDILWCEFALQLAPKVACPADMDLESRTAPAGHLPAIDGACGYEGRSDNRCH
ncbi:MULTISPECIES: DUF6708 domain-containing protein [Pseudomonas]|uniref:DUF6708 domain-containing protein n=1 Tax=Pseudomonas TaxID=286 RepID=UPI002899BAE6|nr:MULTISPECIES: DUF6708 domain-containing protein [unclassified Pseudomonas]